MEALIGELKAKIVRTLNLKDVAPENIDTDAQLVGGALGIDSIDVLELMMIEKNYAVRIDSNELGARVFDDVHCLARHIHENRPEPGH